MSVVDAAERFVAKPTAATLAESAVEDVIVVEGVRMRYGATEAVAGINLCVAGGEIFAFLGPNGAGKTTTVEILEGFRERTKGTVSVLGVDPSRGGRVWRVHRSTSMRGGRSSGRGGPASLQVRPLLSLLYGPCRYGTRTSQQRPLWRSGCGPCSPDTVSEMKSPTHRIVWIPGVLEDIDEGDSPSITTQGRTTGDRQLLKQTPVGSRDRDRPRLRVDHGRRRLL